jgi:hypothetical protein
MRYLATAAILLDCFFFGSASAQVVPFPEREIAPITESIFAKDGKELEKDKCGDYFLYSGAESVVPFITVNLREFLAERGRTYMVIVMQKRNIEVRIDNNKRVPTAEALQGPKFIIRINRADYEKAAGCLPKPLGA